MSRPITRISSRGVQLIADFEGFVDHPYKDAAGVWTIGYGHTKGVGPRTPRITKTEAKRLLRREINETYAPFVADLNLPLTQGAFDALVSFVYNVGAGGISPQTGVGRELRRHRWRHVANELLKWDKAGNETLPGLTRRRNAERFLFLSDLPPRK